MRDCAEMAGLVQGPLSNGDTGSPHRLKLFVESEAACLHWQSFMIQGACLRKGSKFLIVECGGGTVDLVLYEKLGAVPSLSMREEQESSGVLCGDSRVEDELFQFMRRKIRCFRRFESEHPAIVLAFLKVWENIKYRFDGTNEVEYVELDPKLVETWEMEDEGSVVFNGELKLTNDDMKSMFDPIVTRILELIEEKMVPDLTAIMVVGVFSESPYLMKRIRDTFGRNVKFISDVGSKKESTFNVKIPVQEKLGFMPKVEVSMFFGRSEIQVTAVGKNFTGEKTGMLPAKFETSGIY